MPDTKLSGFGAVTALVDADQIPTLTGGAANARITLPNFRESLLRATGTPIHRDNLLPRSDERLIRLFEEMPGVPVYETLMATVPITTTYPFQITPSDHGKVIWANVAGAYADVTGMMNHTTQRFNISAARSLTLYTGTPGVFFTGRTSEQVSVSGPGKLAVHRGQGNEWEIEFINGLTGTDVFTAVPTYNRKFAGLGYSNLVRTMKNVSGWREQFASWGLDQSVVNIPSGVGASSLLAGGEAGFVDGVPGTYNHWWDWRTGTPGPNTTNLIALVAASPAAATGLEFIFVHLGYADMSLFTASMNSLGVALTEAQMVGHWLDCLNYIKTTLGLPGLKFIMCPMAHRQRATWDVTYWYALRRVFLDVCAADPTLAVRGPDTCDVRFIPNDWHPTLRSQAIFSARLARWSETIAGRRSEVLGPKITNFVQDSDTQSRFIITSNGVNVVFPGFDGNWLDAPAPPGIAVVAPGTGYVGFPALAVSKYAWSRVGAVYTLTLTHAAQAGVRPVFPYGYMADTGENPDMHIRNVTTGDPLQTYHPTV